MMLTLYTLLFFQVLGLNVPLLSCHDAKDHDKLSMFDFIMKGSLGKFLESLPKDTENLTDMTNSDLIRRTNQIKTTTTEAATMTDPPQETTTVHVKKPCCTAAGCYDDCPYPIVPVPPIPSYAQMAPQIPLVLHAKAYYEPVIHDHPHPDVIDNLIRDDERRYRRHKHFADVSESSSSDSDSEDSSISDSSEY